MSNLLSPFLRQNPRYRIRDDAEVVVTIDPGDGATDQLRAQLVDISIGGAKFKTDGALRAKKVVSVKIRVAGITSALELAGEICWMTPVTGQEWYVGCSFKPALPEDVLGCLASTGVLDRRLRQRVPVSMPALAKWELDSDETPVSVVDYSQDGGWCLLTRSPVQLGSRVLLRMQRRGQDVVIRGKTQWQSQSGQGFLVGCEFLQGRDAALFAGLLDRQPAATGDARVHAKRLPSLLRIPGIATLQPLAQRQRVRRGAALVTCACFVILLWNNIGSAPFVAIQNLLSMPAAAWSQPRVAAGEQETPTHIPYEADAAATQEPAQTVDVKTQGINHHSWTASSEEHRLLPDAQQAFVSTPSAAVDNHDADATASAAVDEQPIYDLMDVELASEPVTVEPESLPPLVHDLVVEAESKEGEPGDVDTDAADDDALVVNTTESTSPEPLAETSVVQPPRRAERDPELSAQELSRGLSLYRQRQYESARDAFAEAVDADATDPIAAYFLAISQFQGNQRAEADQTLAMAIELEREHPIAAWGHLMEGCQGSVRVWVEAARRRARD